MKNLLSTELVFVIESPNKYFGAVNFDVNGVPFGFGSIVTFFGIRGQKGNGNEGLFQRSTISEPQYQWTSSSIAID